MGLSGFRTINAFYFMGISLSVNRRNYLFLACHLVNTKESRFPSYSHMYMGVLTKRSPYCSLTQPRENHQDYLANCRSRDTILRLVKWAMFVTKWSLWAVMDYSMNTGFAALRALASGHPHQLNSGRSWQIKFPELIELEEQTAYMLSMPGLNKSKS